MRSLLALKPSSPGPQQEKQSSLYSQFDTYYVYLASLDSCSGTNTWQHACNSHGCIRAQLLFFITAAEQEWRKEVKREMLHSHLVVLKTPGMLLL